ENNTMNLKNTLTTLTFGALALAFTGCASIVDSGYKNITVSSEPSGAKATVYDRNGSVILTRSTPAVFTLERSAGYFTPAHYRLRLEHKGYQPAELELKSTMNGWYLGNVLFGGLIGLLIVDPATGAMWTFNPKHVHQVLQSSTASVNKDKSGIVVMLRKDVPEEYASLLQPVEINQ
ncbi:MAG: hypothetical protein ACK4UN_22235, partial [Limisphaerales bacterium]